MLPVFRKSHAGDTCPLWITQHTQEPNRDFWLGTFEWQWNVRLISYWKEQGRIADELGPVAACNFDVSHMGAQQIDPVALSATSARG